MPRLGKNPYIVVLLALYNWQAYTNIQQIRVVRRLLYQNILQSCRDSAPYMEDLYIVDPVSETVWTLVSQYHRRSHINS